MSNYSQHYKDISDYLRAKELPINEEKCITTKTVMENLDTVIQIIWVNSSQVSTIKIVMTPKSPNL